MSRSEMLSTFFVHDGGDTSKWRMKGHAESDFWRWLCSWAVNIRKPSDLGYSDEGFVLPPLNITEHFVEVDVASSGLLFALPAKSLTERREARRDSLSKRVEKTVQIVNGTSEKVCIWCDLNDEQDALARTLKSCVSISGSTPDDDRLAMEREWREGSTQCLVSKKSIFGYGMNWQHCNVVIYCGLSDSGEDFYQSVRRFWRFGQPRPVKAHIVISSRETDVVSNVRRKLADIDHMAAEMIAHMSDISSAEIKGTKRTMTHYEPQKPMELPSWLESEAA